MVNVMSGPRKTRAEAMSCDRNATEGTLHRKWCSVSPILVQLSPCPTPGKVGQEASGGRDWEPEVCAQAGWLWKICLVPCSLRAGPASCRVMRRCMKLSSALLMRVV